MNSVGVCVWSRVFGCIRQNFCGFGVFGNFLFRVFLRDLAFLQCVCVVCLPGVGFVNLGIFWFW